MSLRAFALIAALIACHHDPAPAPLEPADKPPLPPASGTPIGFLIDDATDLKLTDDQLGKLRDIDTGLAADLAVIDTRLRAADHPVEQGSGASQPAMGRHGRRGGMGAMGGGGMGGGGMGGGGRGRRSGGGGAGSGAGSGAGLHAADIGRLTEQRADDVRDAIQRAMAVLDPGQQQTAIKVLENHDIDVDAGRPLHGGGTGQDEGSGGEEP